jgi:hypothetical protein
MTIQKVCENCAKPFKARDREAKRKFCARACQKAYEAAHGRLASRKTPIEFTCKQCGNPFTMMQSYLTALRKKHGRDPLYCSMRCMGDAKKLPAEAWAVNCIQCGKPMPIQRKPGGQVNRQKALCSTECRSLFRTLDYQRKHPDAQPTVNKYKNGYTRTVVPGKNGERSRELLTHRWVMEQHLGRRLFPHETVHHVNGDRSFNDISNLELFSSRHGPGQRVIDKVAFAIEMLQLYPEFAREAGCMLVPVEHPTAATLVAAAPGSPSAPH